MPKIDNFFRYVDNKFLFDTKVWSRGEAYFKEGRVEITYNEEGEIHANVKGSELYGVRLDMNGHNLRKASCSCPYTGYCKHIAAVLMKLDQDDCDEEIEFDPTLPPSKPLIQASKSNLEAKNKGTESTFEKSLMDAYSQGMETGDSPRKVEEALRKIISQNQFTSRKIIIASYIAFLSKIDPEAFPKFFSLGQNTMNLPTGDYLLYFADNESLYPLINATIRDSFLQGSNKFNDLFSYSTSKAYSLLEEDTFISYIQTLNYAYIYSPLIDSLIKKGFRNALIALLERPSASISFNDGKKIEQYFKETGDKEGTRASFKRDIRLSGFNFQSFYSYYSSLSEEERVKEAPFFASTRMDASSSAAYEFLSGGILSKKSLNAFTLEAFAALGDKIIAETSSFYLPYLYKKMDAFLNRYTITDLSFRSFLNIIDVYPDKEIKRFLSDKRLITLSFELKQYRASFLKVAMKNKEYAPTNILEWK